MATPRCFIDTNVLVYSFDRTDKRKQKIATDLTEQLLDSGSGVISSQVVQEFMNVALTKFQAALAAEEFPEVLRDLLIPLCHHFPDIRFYERALQLYSEASLSLYDALIVQAALDLGCKTLYTEDLQAGRRYGDMTITNPFI